MRTTRPSYGDRPRSLGGRITFRLPAILVGAVIGSSVACRPDAISTSPIAPTSPDPAVYSNGIWLVNSLADPGVGTCTNSECTLREAIAVAQSGEGITFKSNLQGTIALTAGELSVARGILIEGPGADRISVSGEGLSRVFRIENGPGVTISALTIAGGDAGSEIGGGILIELGGRLTLVGAVVSGNRANKGGGIATFGPLTLVGSTVAANVASGLDGQGGGVFVGSQTPNAPQITVRRSTISDNTADYAGGLYILCQSDCPVSIASSTITANSATLGTGGLYASGTTTMFNTIIAGNRRDGSLSTTEANCYEFSVLSSLGYNLTVDDTGCGTIGGPTDVLVSAALVFTSVLQPVLAANGSPRLTHALIERGYAIDAGYCPGENGDQRGFPRPYDDPVMPNALDACDIGAFEWQPTDTKNNPK